MIDAPLTRVALRMLLDALAIAAAALAAVVLRTAMRDFDPMTLDRLSGVASQVVPTWVLCGVVCLTLAGWYGRAAPAPGARRLAATLCIAAGLVGMASWGREPWWLFFPLVGLAFSTVAVTAVRSNGWLARRVGA